MMSVLSILIYSTLLVSKFIETEISGRLKDQIEVQKYTAGIYIVLVIYKNCSNILDFWKKNVSWQS